MAGSDDDLFGAEHVRVYRETGGRHGYHWRGTTILLLSTKGRKSGQERTTPLIHRTDGDRWIVVASKGGAPENPSWYENLLADPEATIQVTDQEIPVLASTAQGAERAACGLRWSRYGPHTTTTRPRPTARSRSSCSLAAGRPPRRRLRAWPTSIACVLAWPSFPISLRCRCLRSGISS